MELKTINKDTYVIFSDEELDIFTKANSILYNLLSKMRGNKVNKLTLISGSGPWKLKIDDLAKICIDFGSVSSGSAPWKFKIDDLAKICKDFGSGSSRSANPANFD